MGFVFLEECDMRGKEDFVGNSIGMRQFERPRRRWENNIKIV